MQKRQTLTKLLPAALICAAVLSPAGAAEAKNEITVAVASTFTTMDPWNATDTLSQAVAKSFYEGLFRFDREMNVVPSLAESAESSPDGMQHVVHLRRGVKFHDGTTFTAEAVKANFDRITTPGSTLKRFFLFENVASLKVLDPYTVRFTLKRPNSAFINRLAHPSAVMICPKSLSEKEVSIAFHPCGTGPFVMKNYNPSDVLRVEKNLASCGGKQHARGHGAHGGSRLCVSAAFRAGQNGEGQRHAPRRRHAFDHASLCGNESHEARLQGCPRSSGA